MRYTRWSLSILVLLIVAPLLDVAPRAAAHVPAGQGIRRAPAPTPPPAAARRYRIAKAASRAARSAIAATGAQIEQTDDGAVEIRATPQQAARLKARGYTLQPLDFSPPDAAYHTYAEMVTEVQAVAAAHPQIVQLGSIGQSYEHRDLLMAKVSANVGVDEAEPEALFVGHYHAREHITVEMLLDILHLLADDYGKAGHEQIDELVNTREVWLVFDMNPDGGEYDVQDGLYQSWRKNRQPNAGTPCVGTDPNRNHSYRWDTPGTSASTDPCEITYRGTAPASAPEVKAMEDFVNSRVVSGTQQIKVAITFHSYSELVLWPYGYTTEDVPSDMRPDDQAVFVAMGQAMAATNGYRAEQASDLYTTSGDLTDWAYGVHHIFAYTFEMYPDPRTSDVGFYPPGSVLARETARNHAAVLYLLANAACPYATIGKAETYCAATASSPPARMWLPLVTRTVVISN